MLPSRHILPSRDRKGAVSQFDMSSPGVTDPNKKKLEELARLGWYHSMELPDGRDDQGFVAKFPIDEFVRHCLLNGLDDIGLTLQHEAEIAAYEVLHPAPSALQTPR